MGIGEGTFIRACMKSDAQLTWDESDTPYSRRFEDLYFSREDGRAETRAVFLAGNGLPQAWQNTRHYHIAELGFGTGLNFFETLQQWQMSAPQEAVLHFTSFELYPLSGKEISRAIANWPELVKLADQLRELITGQHALHFGNVQLEIITGDARKTLPKWRGQVDAWYLDGFSPAKNPQLWQAELMQAVFEHTRQGGTFSTYTAAGYVRRNLQEAGFEVQRVPGFGGKRERLQGQKV